jgi:hypothetical protein
VIGGAHAVHVAALHAEDQHRAVPGGDHRAISRRCLVPRVVTASGSSRCRPATAAAVTFFTST